MAAPKLDVDDLIQKLSLDEKVLLLSGIGRCRTRALEHHGIPSIMTSDGPHGIRTEKFFNQPRAACLPSGTAMGATFDRDLIHRIGTLLAAEAKAHGVQLLLAPVVCLQRSPLIGRGFEAFGEDPVLSGTLGGAYIKGLQENGVGACIKHFVAHDQSDNSIEDNIVMTQRTLREVHALSFQIAIRDAEPWAVMTAYHKINGVHCAEDPGLIDGLLRQEWGFRGLVLSDWWGVYSTSEAINAGLDLEMPGPPEWRAKVLALAVHARKVSMEAVDASVRRVLELVNTARPIGEEDAEDANANTEEARALIRRLTADSVVLLKNDQNVLPLSGNRNVRYALIGDHWETPALAGGGSSEVEPYYISRPYDAFLEVVPRDQVVSALGCYSHKFTPLLNCNITQPSSAAPGLLLEFFTRDNTTSEPTYIATTAKTMMNLADSFPPGAIPENYFLRIRTTFKAPKTTRYRFGLSVAGKAKLLIDGKEEIDQWTSHPKKTDNTPCFNGFTMERFAELDVEQGVSYDLEIQLINENLGDRVGAAPAGGVRLGGHEVVDEDKTIQQAVEVAHGVDFPIILTGLSSDYESEGLDRKSLGLPGRVDELIARVMEANPNTIVITEAGTAIAMHWADKAPTVLHSWLGGQETGHGIVDVLFGRVNPSGRLPMTFPRCLEDSPAFLNFGKSDVDIVYGEGVFIGHRYHEQLNRPPQFYFGHGLSYTSFEYSGVSVPDIVHADNLPFTVSVTIQNVGQRPGAEVVQVYVRDVECSVQRPKKELKGFKKVYLEAGETTLVSIEFDKYALSFWCQRISRWVAEQGMFEVIVATSGDPAAEVLCSTFKLAGQFSWSGL
ncbi:hypothetical protein BDW74DRAFT_189189 [Aspergillus multicolor]|uniref:glycoside hydrolase family 3 protein n=1 Tax=Aspergillus multicolor TaxID=41759 RepID=UPI003CCE1FDE